MSNTFNIDSLPTIPSSWTAPTSCFASTLYYRVLLSGGYFSNLYGTPTPVLTGNVPTGDCFPPSFTINTPYQTDGDCPSGYTRACATAGPDRSGKPVSTVTCCPSVTGNAFSFMCKDHEYGCHGTGTVGAVWTGGTNDCANLHRNLKSILADDNCACDNCACDNPSFAHRKPSERQQ
ncbi:hypothetical protein CH063_04547 [Colletotrichum higginsianum]|uniref:Uncharacterized protein n=1 Tax=Colletotrichum higginsianum (strain IMI 349063) TaxID=759273 RepID=H1UVU3_COLHI|nr:hypothetical protein CH063_04547 [Colletotrichum higginsianum]